MPLHSLARTTLRRHASDALLVFPGCHHFSCSTPKLLQGCSARLLPPMKNFTLSGSLGRDPRADLDRNRGQVAGQISENSTAFAPRRWSATSGYLMPASSMTARPSTGWRDQSRSSHSYRARSFRSHTPAIALASWRNRLIERCVARYGPTPCPIVNKSLQVNSRRCQPRAKNVPNSQATLVTEVSEIRNR